MPLWLFQPLRVVVQPDVVCKDAKLNLYPVDAKISSNFPPGLCDSNVFLSRVFKGSNSETTDTPEYFSIASCYFVSFPFNIIPSKGRFLFFNSLTVSSVWLMVPRPLLATNKIGNFSFFIISTIKYFSFIGTNIPPAPSTITFVSFCGSKKFANSILIPSLFADSCGDRVAVIRRQGEKE